MRVHTDELKTRAILQRCEAPYESQNRMWHSLYSKPRQTAEKEEKQAQQLQRTL